MSLRPDTTALPRPPIAVRPAARGDAQAVAATLARAFCADPVMAYIFPDEATRPRRLLRFFGLVVAAESDPANCLIAGDFAAATIWRGPGEGQVRVSTMLRQLLPMIATFGTALPRALALQALIDRHHPADPHWYLAFAGCDPAYQGHGFGGAAIRAQLQTCDSQRVPAALETANEANLPIYQALGFAVSGEFRVTPDLGFWAMWRSPA